MTTDTSTNTDPGSVLLEAGLKTNQHVRGFHGDGGENEGVLSVIAVCDGSPHYPESGRIIVGSPEASPLIEGYIPNLGGFSCGVDAARRLIRAVQRAIDDVEAAKASGR